MLYKPKFCCECGEKIERVDWKIWTNRRFCEVCEAEYKLSDILPKAGIGICVLLGLFGLGSYLKEGSASDLQVIKRSAASSRPTNSAAVNIEATANTAVQSQPNGPTRAAPANVSAADVIVNNPRVAPAEKVYYCGARTKKGIPCTRRVKGNVRCWQHTGMPAMNAPEKLIVNR